MRRRREVFEKMVWDGEQMRAVPAVGGAGSPTAQDADHAAAALRALAGFECTACHKTLTPADGYVCCNIAYCPLCGSWAQNYQSTCPHVVFASERHEWDTCFPRSWKNFYGSKVAPPELALAPPGRRLPTQKESGWPSWSHEQLGAAYAPDVRPHLEPIFGPTLRHFGPQRFLPFVFRAMQPDLRTARRGYSGHYREFYFCSDPQAGFDRAVTYLNHFHEGTRRLREMEPHRIVRPDAT